MSLLGRNLLIADIKNQANLAFIFHKTYYLFSHRYIALLSKQLNNSAPQLPHNSSGRHFPEHSTQHSAYHSAHRAGPRLDEQINQTDRKNDQINQLVPQANYQINNIACKHDQINNEIKQAQNKLKKINLEIQKEEIKKLALYEEESRIPDFSVILKQTIYI